MDEHELFGLILKQSKTDQFPVDEILNEKDRLVRAYLSVELKDKQGDIIPIEEFRKTLNTWMKRDAPVNDTHTNRKIGKGLRWFETVHPKNKKPAIALDYIVHDDYSVDDQVWKEIKSGKRKGLSFGGRSTKAPELKFDKDSNSIARKLSHIEAYEVSSVTEPANQLAENFAINFLAKSDTFEATDIQKKEAELLIKDFQKGYAVGKGENTNKTFAGFETFDVCTVAQRAKGHDEESANRICGFLQSRTESKDKKKSEVTKGKDKLFEALKDKVSISEEQFNAAYKEAYPEGKDEKKAEKYPEEDKKDDEQEEKISKLSESVDNVIKLFSIRKVEKSANSLMKSLEKRKV